ncbi:MAG: hypothetical protein R2873_11195 [Caldilineaceae bacterium]
MKYLTILRHAKAAVPQTNQPDIERPLQEKGRRQIQLIAPVIQGIKLFPDRVLSSPATCGRYGGSHRCRHPVRAGARAGRAHLRGCAGDAVGDPA